MGTTFEEAADTLYRGAFDAFVEARKRLATALKTEGLAEEAKALASLAKPPRSAWTVNQLYWHERRLVDDLFAATSALRRAPARSPAFADAALAQRASLAHLRKAAAARLAGDGHAAGEPLLRRILTTLQAVAASGSFAPDAPGRLIADRDPLGFEALADSAIAEAPARAATAEAAAVEAAAPRKSKSKRAESAIANESRRAESDEATAAKAHARKEARVALAAARVAHDAAAVAAEAKAARWRELAAAAKAEQHDATAAERAVVDAERALHRAKDELDRARRRADASDAAATDAETARDTAEQIERASRAEVERAKAKLAKHGDG